MTRILKTDSTFRRYSFPLALLMATTLAAVDNARASLVNLAFTGTVNFVAVGGPSPTGVSVGNTLIGSLTYDDTTGTPAGGSNTAYDLTAFSLTVPDTNQPGGNFTLTGTSPTNLNASTDVVLDVSNQFVGLQLPPLVTGFSAQLTAPSITPNAFTLISPTFDDPLGGATFTFRDSSFIAVQGTFAPIPLPAAAWLFLTALGGLGWFGRRKVS